MNADTASPTTPSPAPGTPAAPAPGPAGGNAPGAASLPVGMHGHHTTAEPNALLVWSQKAWANLKEGKFGNPKLLLLVVAVVGIGLAWWFLAKSSKESESALWSAWAMAPATPEAQQKLREEQSIAKSVAGPLSQLGELRLKQANALRRLTAEKVADRQAAADDLEKLRDELANAAGLFPNDPTLKAAAYLDAAETELALIGVPKKGVAVMGVEVQKHSRGQVSKYVELLRSAADAVGPTTEAGQGIAAKADKYAKELEAGELYTRLGTFHSNFNNPDPVGGQTDPLDPTDPFGGEPFPGVPGGPLPPTSVPGGSVGPTEPPLGPGEAPKPPTQPLDPPK